MRAHPLLATALLTLGTGCGEPVNLGSNLLWSARHESGDLSEWLTGNGGVEADDGIEPPAVTAAQAKSGGFSVVLVASSNGREVGPGLFREVTAERAFYSIWYYLPAAYETPTGWTLQRFDTLNQDDPPAFAGGFDLRARTLPGGEVVLYVFHHDGEFLQWPLADPPPFLPVGSWFHVECELVARNDEQGRFSVWLDGELVYDIRGRRSAWSSTVQWSARNVAQEVLPPPVEVFVDDAAISLTRVGPSGVLAFE